MQPQACPHLNKDGEIAHILIQVYVLRMLFFLHDTVKNPLTISGNDEDAEMTTE